MESHLRTRIESFGPGAEVRITRGQGIAITLFLVLSAAIVLVFQLSLLQCLQIFVGICTLFFVAMFTFSFYVAVHGIREGSLINIGREEVEKLLSNPQAVARLPFITIIVAAYQEATVVDQLIESLKMLVYPEHKLEVLIVLEENDKATQHAFDQTLPWNWKVVVRPNGGIKTKPGAMNYLLENGYVSNSSVITVVFDAEDQPSRFQLLEAVLAFTKARNENKDVVCIQARLEFSQNAHKGWLQRMLSIDYLQHFGLVLPGLSRLGHISPLGGTSNYIRTDILMSIGGWDARNVTEDMNLAVILARLNYDIYVLNSVTSEEAVSTVKDFVYQRSRWIKGGIQTYFTHMRDPVQLYRDLGFARFIGFQLVIGAPLVLYLINPIFWGLTFTYAVTQSAYIQAMYPPAIFYGAIFCFTAGNFMYVYLLLTASFRTGNYSGLVFGLFAPFYWFLLSIAGYKAMFEFVHSSEGAQKWEKTQHKGT